MEVLRTDVAIVGGGLGACAAALAAARLGRRVILTEETHWVGGQLTNQVVPPMSTRGSKNSVPRPATGHCGAAFVTTTALTYRSPPVPGHVACSTRAMGG